MPNLPEGHKDSVEVINHVGPGMAVCCKVCHLFKCEDFKLSFAPVLQDSEVLLTVLLAMLWLNVVC